MDAGGKVGDIAGGTAGLLASGLKDNVQLLDSVSRSTVGNVGKALGSALHEAKTPADAAQEAAAAEAAARHAASQLELLKSFEQWLDELGGGAQLEALEKLRKGMRVLIREGSVSKDLHALQPVLTERTAPYMCLCTDDRNPLDIAEHGHLDYMIRTLISLGTPPLAAYRAASLSAAEAFGLKDRGMIAPGKRADIVAVDSLEGCHAQLVLAAGVRADDAAFAARETLPPVGRGSVQAPRITASQFRATGNREETDVIGIREGQILTDHLHERIAIEDGDKRPDSTRDLVRIAVVERHGRNGNIATGFVKGFGLQAGAIASTVCHDHHNIACVGVGYDDMALAANRLEALEGGFVVAKGGEILAELALPVAGLMSLEPFETVRDRLVDLRAAARGLGVTLEEPFLQLAFLALPVIPALKITDRGMVDVTTFEIIPG